MTATNEPPPNSTTPSPPPIGTTGASSPAPKRLAKPPSFDHPLMLQQTSVWSRAILWGLMATATTAVLWANFSRIEEAIPVQGKLEPQGAVKDVQVPVSGVVKAVYVQDGQRVNKGDRLLSLDQTSPQSQLDSLSQVRTALLQENQFYQAQMQGKTIAVSGLQISPQFLSLTKSRAAVVSENELFRTQLDGSTQASLTAAQQERLQSNQAELNSRAISARLETEQVRRQLSQTQVRLGGLRKTLALNQRILIDMEPVALSGAISRMQYLKQQQEVTTSQSEVDQLVQEQARLEAAIAQSQIKVQNTLEVDRKDNTAQIAHNDQRIAEIDGQLTKAIVENNKKISEIDSQITQSQQTLKYSQLSAPVGGTVFELKANASGFVASPTEPILKIVPDDSLIAKVSITNHDIGFVKEGMTVDVRIDSFPFSEFGDVRGTIVWIGSDALPPTQIQPAYTFPAKIRLDKQSLMADGREVRLQSGMSLNANVKLRSRTIMSIFTDQFTKTAESMKFVR